MSRRRDSPERAAESRTAVRRADRAVRDDAWIGDALRAAPVGVVATVANSQPFLNSNLFVYDEAAHAIYLHTARQGRTRANVEAHDQVAFTVFTMGRLLPASTALEFSVEYACVVVFGTGAIVTDRAEARRGLELLMDKYAPHLVAGRDYRPITDSELEQTSVFRIRIEEWVGKRKQVADDFPGAYRYREPR